VVQLLLTDVAVILANLIIGSIGNLAVDRQWMVILFGPCIKAVIAVVHCYTPSRDSSGMIFQVAQNDLRKQPSFLARPVLCNKYSVIPLNSSCFLVKNSAASWLFVVDKFTESSEDILRWTWNSMVHHESIVRVESQEILRVKTLVRKMKMALCLQLEMLWDYFKDYSHLLSEKLRAIEHKSTLIFDSYNDEEDFDRSPLSLGHSFSHFLCYLCWNQSVSKGLKVAIRTHNYHEYRHIASFKPFHLHHGHSTLKDQGTRCFGKKINIYLS